MIILLVEKENIKLIFNIIKIKKRPLIKFDINCLSFIKIKIKKLNNIILSEIKSILYISM